jgi:ubiquinone/menaquinone biosynthesis C-methylase UbiE
LKRRWDEITHASKSAYNFRLKYIMGPLQKMAALTPWFDENLARGYDEELARTYREWLAGATVLDLGCGPGRLSRDFPQKFGAQAYVGLDVSAGMVQDAQADNPEAHFLCGNVLALPFRDKSFDVVHSARLFHHLEPEIRTLAVVEQLRVAAKAVIVEDLFGFPPGPWRYPHETYYRLADGSHYRFTLQEWRNMFAKLKVRIAKSFFTGEHMIVKRCACWVLQP